MPGEPYGQIESSRRLLCVDHSTAQGSSRHWRMTLFESERVLLEIGNLDPLLFGGVTSISSSQSNLVGSHIQRRGVGSMSKTEVG